MKILLIEDDVVDAKHFIRLFQEQHEIFVCTNAADAVTAIKTEYDLIVCDYNIPGAIDNVLIKLLLSRGYENKLIILSGVDRGQNTILKTELGYKKLKEWIEQKCS